MTITITPEYAGRSGNATVDNLREYDLALIATTTSTESEEAISLASGCPRKFDPYGFDSGARLVSMRIQQDPANELIWRIRGHYSTQYGQEAGSPGGVELRGSSNDPHGARGPAEQPLLHPCRWRTI